MNLEGFIVHFAQIINVLGETAFTASIVAKFNPELEQLSSSTLTMIALLPSAMLLSPFSFRKRRKL